MTYNKFVFFEIILNHDNCWTSETNDRYRDILLTESISISNFYLDAVRLVSYEGDLKNMVRRIQNNFNFSRISLYSTDYYGRYVLSMKVPYETSILSKFYRNNVIVLSAHVTDGLEIYEITCTRSSSEKLQETLTRDSTVELIEMNEYYSKDPFTMMLTREIGQMLTEKERFIVKLGVTNGFFESPRKVDLSFLAKASNLSKKRVSVILKNVQNKVFSYILD